VALKGVNGWLYCENCEQWQSAIGGGSDLMDCMNRCAKRGLAEYGKREEEGKNEVKQG
jgi:hypothetical protein